MQTRKLESQKQPFQLLHPWGGGGGTTESRKHGPWWTPYSSRHMGKKYQPITSWSNCKDNLPVLQRAGCFSRVGKHHCVRHTFIVLRDKNCHVCFRTRSMQGNKRMIRFLAAVWPKRGTAQLDLTRNGGCAKDECTLRAVWVFYRGQRNICVSHQTYVVFFRVFNSRSGWSLLCLGERWTVVAVSARASTCESLFPLRSSRHLRRTCTWYDTFKQVKKNKKTDALNVEVSTAPVTVTRDGQPGPTALLETPILTTHVLKFCGHSKPLPTSQTVPFWSAPLWKLRCLPQHDWARIMRQVLPKHFGKDVPKGYRKSVIGSMYERWSLDLSTISRISYSSVVSWRKQQNTCRIRVCSNFLHFSVLSWRRLSLRNEIKDQWARAHKEAARFALLRGGGGEGSKQQDSKLPPG